MCSSVVDCLSSLEMGGGGEGERKRGMEAELGE